MQRNLRIQLKSEDSMKKWSMGVDIGGSHITCQLFDLNANKLEPGTRIRIPVDGNASKESILNNWVNAIKQTTSNREINNLAGIGFAMPGPFDYRNGVAWFDKNVDKFQNLYGVDVKAELLQKLNLSANFPIRFLNDAASFAVGEANLEPGSKYKRIIALTIGTGFGTTFIKNGLPLAGEDGIPEDGFLYHIPFQKGIADDYFSTRWFLNEYKKRTENEVTGVKELVENAKNDRLAKELFAEFGNNLGSFLIPWIQSFNAGCIILGGNISKSFSLFEEKMKNQFKLKGIEIFICQSTLDEDAALIGSAKLCDDNFYSKLTRPKI